MVPMESEVAEAIEDEVDGMSDMEILLERLRVSATDVSVEVLLEIARELVEELAAIRVELTLIRSERSHDRLPGTFPPYSPNTPYVQPWNQYPGITYVSNTCANTDQMLLSIDACLEAVSNTVSGS